MSTDQCLWGRYADGGSMPGVIGIDVDDFLIGLPAGALGDKGCLNFNRCTSGVCGRKVKQSLPELE